MELSGATPTKCHAHLKGCDTFESDKYVIHDFSRPMGGQILIFNLCDFRSFWTVLGLKGLILGQKWVILGYSGPFLAWNQAFFAKIV